LDGSEPLLSAITDSTGCYEINDIPSGTYNIIVSKEGYGEYQRQGFQIVGGKEPLYFNGSIVEKSSTTIDDLSLEIVNGTDIYLKCIVNHTYSASHGNNQIPAIRYFINNTDNPSDTNYLQTNIAGFEGESGTQLFSLVYLNEDLFPSGSKIYIRAYGCNGVWGTYLYLYGYYDILLNQYVDVTLGKASNIASIIVP